MLHSSSSHYYAYYYALLCLLYHQQRLAQSVTLIIDGANTNEWAKRGEYQRQAGGLTGDQQLSHAELEQRLGGADVALIEEPQQRPLALAADQILRSLSAGAAQARAGDNFKDSPENSAAIAQQRQRGEGNEDEDEPNEPNNNNKHDEQQQEDNDQRQRQVVALTGGAAGRLLRAARMLQTPTTSTVNSFKNPSSSSSSSRLALSSASSSPDAEGEQQQQLISEVLDRLEIIERERAREQSRLKQIEALERVAEADVASALTSSGNKPHNVRIIEDLGQLMQQQQQQHRDGLPTLDDADELMDSEKLRSLHNDDSERPGAVVNPWRQHGNKRRKQRDTAAHWCGPKLIDMLEFVCENRFADYSVPEVVAPTIKTKRSAADADAADQQARRKLRQLEDGDGEPESQQPASSLSLVHDGKLIGDGTHDHHHEALMTEQQKQWYLSKQQQQQFDDHNKDNNNNNLSISLERSNGRQGRQAKSRRPRGITQECCVNACTTEHLKQYCKSKP